MSELIKLGRTDLNVSRVCFGCWQMGGDFWGTANESNLIAAVHRGLDLGVNFFDTSDEYGWGQSEQMLGRALKGIARDKFVVATKVYHRFVGPEASRRVGDLSYEHVIEGCEQSLKRLGLEYIDLYQAHRFDVTTHLEETSRAFEKLCKDGKIRYYGSTGASVEQLRAALAFGKFYTVQPRYNLFDLGIERDVLPFCMAENLGVLVYSPLRSGMLSGKYDGTKTISDNRARMPDFQGQQFKDNVAKVNQIKPLAQRLGKTVPQLVLRALLTHGAVHCVIVGIKNPAQIEDCSGAMGWKLDRADYYQIRRTFMGY